MISEQSVVKDTMIWVNDGSAIRAWAMMVQDDGGSIQRWIPLRDASCWRHDEGSNTVVERSFHTCVGCWLVADSH